MQIQQITIQLMNYHFELEYIMYLGGKRIQWVYSAKLCAVI